ncbi:MAG: alpha/beta hydrolase family esterase [Roseateles sp.]|uniref:alpha/beta hydrolase family esterase n=1 Tax=Roseateles sp. TaxID=1971397 RepID=UPI0040369FDD
MRLSSLTPLLLALCALPPLANANANTEAPASACSLSPVASEMRELTSGGRTRTYRLFVPPLVGRRATLPLVLDLHGSGGDAAGQARTSGFEALAAREGFAVASLQAEGSRWNVPVTAGRADDVQYVSDVLDHIASRSCIDSARIYATGFSGGGRMSSLLGCRLNHRIAAIAPVGGLRWTGPCPGRALPVLGVHGLADLTNAYEGGGDRGGEWVDSVPQALAGWATHNRCQPKLAQEDPPGPSHTVRYTGCAGGAEVRLLRIDGMGHIWPRTEIDATHTIWQFFKDHSLQ